MDKFAGALGPVTLKYIVAELLVLVITTELPTAPELGEIPVTVATSTLALPCVLLNQREKPCQPLNIHSARAAPRTHPST